MKTTLNSTLTKCFTSVLLASAVAFSLTGCSNKGNSVDLNEPASAPGTNNSATENSSTSGTTSTDESSTSSTTSEPAPQPENPKAPTLADYVKYSPEAIPQTKYPGINTPYECAQYVVFDERTIGGYTYTFCGNDVANDQEFSSGNLYMDSSYVNVIKDGEIVDNVGSSFGIYDAGQGPRLLKMDKLTEYFDVFEMKDGIIVALYYYTEDGQKLANFNAIYNGRSEPGLMGNYSGVGGATTDKITCVSKLTCDAENNTLTDEESGAKYKFNLKALDGEFSPENPHYTVTADAPIPFHANQKDAPYDVF